VYEDSNCFLPYAETGKPRWYGKIEGVTMYLSNTGHSIHKNARLFGSDIATFGGPNTNGWPVAS
jgi:hypothetical protein